MHLSSTSHHFHCQAKVPFDCRPCQGARGQQSRNSMPQFSLSFNPYSSFYFDVIKSNKTPHVQHNEYADTDASTSGSTYDGMRRQTLPSQHLETDVTRSVRAESVPENLFDTRHFSRVPVEYSNASSIYTPRGLQSETSSVNYAASTIYAESEANYNDERALLSSPGAAPGDTSTTAPVDGIFGAPLQQTVNAAAVTVSVGEDTLLVPNIAASCAKYLISEGQFPPRPPQRRQPKLTLPQVHRKINSAPATPRASPPSTPHSPPPPPPQSTGPPTTRKTPPACSPPTSSRSLNP